MREEVAVREWCFERAQHFENFRVDKAIDSARQIEAYITNKPVSLAVEFKDVAYIAYSDGTWGKLEIG